MRALIYSSACVLALPLCLVASEVMVSVPVRQLGPASEPDPRPAETQRRTPPQIPTLVRGLLPQYQSVRAFRSDAAKAPDPDNSTLRLLLAMPDRLLLLEATVTIDGQPHEMIRERRIDRLLAELRGPVREGSESASQLEAKTANTKDSSASSVNSKEVSGAEAGEANGVEPIAMPGSDLESRLRRYAEVTGRPPTRDEVRWLLTKWVDGPTLLVLDENFQRYRSVQAPVFHVLDRDMDNTVSPEEMQASRDTISSCDVNQNDVVEYTEIAHVAKHPRRQSSLAPVQALIPILDAASVAKAFRRLAGRYASLDALRKLDTNSDGGLDSGEIARLSQIEPDVTLVVSFDTTDLGASEVTITRISCDPPVDPKRFRTVGPSITIPIGGSLLELSAVQSPAMSGSDQVSVGTINDGYPLLPALDPNEDGRLTIREMRSVIDELKRFDANADGGISLDEIPMTVRVAFGLGPTVHLHLADIRSVHPPPTAPPAAAPDWFTRMDRNQDGDISPREFLLGRVQFETLDADNDGLISPTEAIQSTGQ